MCIAQVVATKLTRSRPLRLHALFLSHSGGKAASSSSKMTQTKTPSLENNLGAQPVRYSGETAGPRPGTPQLSGVCSDPPFHLPPCLTIGVLQEEVVLAESRLPDGSCSQIVFCHDKHVSASDLERLCVKVGWPARPIHKVEMALRNSFLVCSLVLRISRPAADGSTQVG
jgi:hypothetical protein